MAREVGLQNPTRRCGGLQHPFYGRTPYADAGNVEGRCECTLKLHLGGMGSISVGAELFRACGHCFPCRYCDRSDCDVGRVHQRGPLDVVCAVCDRLGVGIPSLAVAVPPSLEGRGNDGTIVRRRDKQERDRTKLCGSRPGIYAHGARSPPSAQNAYSGPEGWPR